MEGVGFSLKYLIHIFHDLDVEINQIALAGGGTRTPGWAQIFADICQLPVCVYTGLETVTHALFAYACLAVNDPRSFEQALLDTFEEPIWLQPNQEYEEKYNQVFNRYTLKVEKTNKNSKFN